MRKPVGVPARLLVSNLRSETTTWLDRQNLLSASVSANLNLPWQITADVRSGDPAVNTIYGDGDPLVAQSNRLVWVFLNEAPTNAMTDKRWVPRASGILMSPQDQGDTDTGTTHFVAYDPWQYMMGLPCFIDQIGTMPGSSGFLFTATGNVIAYTLIQNTQASLAALGGFGSGGVFADIPNAYGGTVHWTGTNEVTPLLNFRLQQGVSLGQALAQLCTAGSNVEGTSQCIDILFEPIYDPINRPGYVSQISVYDLAGIERPGAPMAWSRFTRSSTTADRQHDGTPGAFVNVAQYVPGQGTPLLPGQIVTNPSSIAKYYPYWEQRWFPGQPFATVTKNLSIQTLQLRKQGKRTFMVDPDPLRAAMPFRDYTIGDRIPIYTPGVTSGRATGLRVAEAGFERVETIPLVIGPDGVTRVNQLLVSPDWPQDEAS
jgi:hypothetical protein